MILEGDALIKEIAVHNKISLEEARRSLRYVSRALRNAFEFNGVTMVRFPRLFSVGFNVSFRYNSYSWLNKERTTDGTWYVSPKLKMGRSLRTKYRDNIVRAAEQQRQVMESGNVPSEIFQVEHSADGKIARFL